MLVAGEDARFIARRIVIFASEDIGMADPSALSVATAAAHAVEYVGLPEAQLNLAQAVIHMATAPKSNSATAALGAAMADVRAGRGGSVPRHLRDAHYQGARGLGHGSGYRYPHDDPRGVVTQQYAARRPRHGRLLPAERARRGACGGRTAADAAAHRARRRSRRGGEPVSPRGSDRDDFGNDEETGWLADLRSAKEERGDLGPADAPGGSLDGWIRPRGAAAGSAATARTRAAGGPPPRAGSRWPEPPRTCRRAVARAAAAVGAASVVRPPRGAGRAGAGTRAAGPPPGPAAVRPAAVCRGLAGDAASRPAWPGAGNG